MSENPNIPNTNVDNRLLKHEKHLIEIRRARVLELLSQGWTEVKIGERLNVSQATVSEDYKHIRIKAREETRNFIQNLPMLVKQSATALKLISIETWKLVNSASDIKDKIHALALLKDVERQKVELYSNTNIVDALVGAAEAAEQGSISVNIAQTEVTTITTTAAEEQT